MKELCRDSKRWGFGNLENGSDSCRNTDGSLFHTVCSTRVLTGGAAMTEEGLEMDMQTTILEKR